MEHNCVPQWENPDEIIKKLSPLPIDMAKLRRPRHDFQQLFQRLCVCHNHRRHHPHCLRCLYRHHVDDEVWRYMHFQQLPHTARKFTREECSRLSHATSSVDICCAASSVGGRRARCAVVAGGMEWSMAVSGRRGGDR